jgi:hypothetical protein
MSKLVFERALLDQPLVFGDAQTNQILLQKPRNNCCKPKKAKSSAACGNGSRRAAPAWRRSPTICASRRARCNNS